VIELIIYSVCCQLQWSLLFAAVADIFKRQMQARIMVGDPHQQIYGFRGAINAMDLVQATRTFYLTQVLDYSFYGLDRVR